MVLEGGDRQVYSTIDPNACEDINLLRESLHHANNMIMELLDQQRKLKNQNTRIKAEYNTQANK